MNDSDVRTTTKRELVSRIADATGQTKVVVRDILQRFLNEVIEELASGNRLEFREFGVFEVRERAARTAQNPRTLEKVMVPAKKVVKFKVGRVMRQRVCEELSETEGGASRAAGRGAAGTKGAAAAGRAASSGASVNGAAGAAHDPAAAEGAGTGDAGSERGASGQKPSPPTPPPTRPGSPF